MVPLTWPPGVSRCLRFPRLTPLFLRTGAAFVHDWLAPLIGALVGGHIWMASRDPEARSGLRTGLVPRSWAKRHHPLREGEQPGDHQAMTVARPVNSSAGSDADPLG